MEKTHQPWTAKYAPISRDDLVGDPAKFTKILDYVQKYKRGQRPIVLIGKSGIGKSTIPHVVARELDLELLEVNAADSRNKEAVETIIGGAAAQQSLFFRGKLILIDEADGISGRNDCGGVQALLAIIPKSTHPIIITINEEDDKLKSLLKVCEVMEIDLTNENIVHRLEYIAATEKITIAKEQLNAIARKSSGDLRAAINDLQSIAGLGSVSKEDVQLLDDREAKEAMQQALTKIFKTTSAEIALPSLDNVDRDPDELIKWIDENLPREYQTPQDLARGFDALAEADKFFGRIRRWQYYRYYVYIFNLLTAGIALAKDKKYAKMIEYQPTGRILKIWIYNQKNFKRKKLAEGLAPHLHTSTKRVRQDVLPYLKIMYKNNKKLGKILLEQYELDPEAIDWFDK